MAEGRDKRRVIAWIAAILTVIVMGIALKSGNDKTNNALNQVKQVVRQNKASIVELRKTKANVTQLQKSNCSLRRTLQDARIKAYHRNIKAGQTHDQAIKSVVTLTIIIDGLDGEYYCPTPKKYKLPTKESING